MKSTNWNRRDLLKTLGAAPIGSAITKPGKGSEGGRGLPLPTQSPSSQNPNKALSCIIVGAGNRGWTYSRYAANYPDQMKIIGIAEPVKIRQDTFKQAFGIDDQNIFDTWEQVFERPRFADFVIVSTIDRHHYGAAMKALEAGYHVLLEKAIAQSWEECKDILEQSRKYDRIVGICHVLRYSPYFEKMNELIHSGRIGEVVSIQHMEPIQNIHFSHSFVRGNWHNEKESTPSLLSKSCHDLDIIYWLLGKKCRKVNSFGGLKYFQSGNAPDGSTQRCTGGCAVEATCPYSALRIYHRERLWGVGHLIDLQAWEEEKVLAALKNGPYGHCVFHNDNDVADHQIVNMEFEDEITVTFSMEGHTSYAGRRTRVMGTQGDIVGDEQTLTISNFSRRDSKTFTAKELNSGFEGGGHGGGDYRLVSHFLRAVSREDASLLNSTIEESMESHYIGYKAEESRHNGGKLIEL